MPIALQNRVLLGITFFVGILLLIGWIAINEPARMPVFTNQYHGRSIENGASIFQNNCSLCHGPDGKGINGRAPGLKNPMLFVDKNPAQEAQTRVADLQKQLDQANNLPQQLDADKKSLAEKQGQLATETDAAKKQALTDEISKLQTQISRETDALPNAQKQAADIQAQIDKTKADLDDLVSKGWDPNRPPRIKEVGWGGTLQQYIENAVSAGRPISALYWPAAMPTWGQQYGGPMRPDEVSDVTNYILNWRDEALKEIPGDIQQQFKVPSDQAVAAAGPAVKAEDILFTKFGKDDKGSVSKLGDLNGGDAANGEKLYTSYGCAGCHAAGTVGPLTQGTFYRAVKDRVNAPEIAAEKLTPEQYLAQSILYPNHYVVPTFTAGVMPQNFGEKMDLQQLKDLIAFLKTKNLP